MTIELVTKLIWILVGLTIVWLAFGLGFGRIDEPGPGMMSAGLGGVIALIGTGGVISLLVKGQTEELSEPWTEGMVWRIATVLLLLAAYISLFERIGFLILTVALMSALFGFLGGIRWRWAIPLAIVLTACNYALFKLALGVQLPAGILG